MPEEAKILDLLVKAEESIKYFHVDDIWIKGRRSPKMPTKIMIDCPHCKGTGKIPHNCHPGDCLVVKKIWSRENACTHSSESLTIRKCKTCGQPYKVRHQWDDGTGSDDIWLMPGESRRGYEFSLEEAAEYSGEGHSIQPTLFTKEEIESCQPQSNSK